MTKMPPKEKMESPSGLDLHPTPPNPVRVSKRATAGLILLGIILLAALAYGAYRRNNFVAAKQKEAEIPNDVAPVSKEATMEAVNAVPVGFVPVTAGGKVKTSDELIPPGQNGNSKTEPTAKTNSQAKPSLPPSYPQQYSTTGFPGQPTYMVTGYQTSEPTPEEKRRAVEEQREQEAMLAPTTTKSAAQASSQTQFGTTPTSSTGSPDLAAIEQLTKSLIGVAGKPATPSGITLEQVAQKLGLGSSSTPSPSSEDAQSQHEEFLKSRQKAAQSNYLAATRRAPLSPYEIKAGWEIPAMLEQSLDSDLPGELKALVTSNVYDTAEGKYILIPQGARLLGKYDSHVVFGQDGVPVVWNRVIYPDGSSLDLDAMEGLDSHGNAGMRGTVDRHYKRIIGFAALTSLMSAGFAISQNRNTSALTYPTWQESAASGVGQSLNELGSQVTRRNLNVQPTIKVPAGTRFTVRVNKDILFDRPYKPVQMESSRPPETVAITSALEKSGRR